MSKSVKQTKVKTIKIQAKNVAFSNQDLIDKLNNAMDNPETEMLSSKYYEPNEINDCNGTRTHTTQLSVVHELNGECFFTN